METKEKDDRERSSINANAHRQYRHRQQRNWRKEDSDLVGEAKRRRKKMNSLFIAGNQTSNSSNEKRK